MPCVGIAVASTGIRIAVSVCSSCGWLARLDNGTRPPEALEDHVILISKQVSELAQAEAAVDPEVPTLVLALRGTRAKLRSMLMPPASVIALDRKLAATFRKSLAHTAARTFEGGGMSIIARQDCVC